MLFFSNGDVEVPNGVVMGIHHIYICNGNIDGILMDIPSGVIKYGKLGNHPAEKSSINVVRWLGTVEGCTEIGAKKSMATY